MKRHRPSLAVPSALAALAAALLHSAPSFAVTLEVLEDASRELARAGGPTDIASSASTFVISTYSSSVLVSIDGLSWQTIALPAGASSPTMTFTNGRFWASYSGGVCWSATGFDWSCETTGASSMSEITFGNGRYFAYAMSYLYTSTDGVSWTQVDAPLEHPSESSPRGDYGIGSLVFDGSRFILAQLPGGGANKYRYFGSSGDGVWTPVASSSLEPAVVLHVGGRLSFGGGTYVMGCHCTFFDDTFWEAVGSSVTSFPKSGRPTTKHTVVGRDNVRNALQGVASVDGMVVAIAGRGSDPDVAGIYAGRSRPPTNEWEGPSSERDEEEAAAATTDPRGGASSPSTFTRSSSGCSTSRAPAPSGLLALVAGVLLAGLRARRDALRRPRA